MKVVSTNIGERRKVLWKSKEYTTGIFKYPVDDIYLGSKDVEEDAVVDRKYHGGTDKACYIYSADYYSYWKKLYPALEWGYGMFGENITVEGLDESELFIGDIFKLGEAVVQISEPRQPCVKLNLRFDSSQMIKQFIAFEHCGAYLRVMQEGAVKSGDTFELLESPVEKISVMDVYQVLYNKKSDSRFIDQILNSPHQTDTIKDEVRKVYSL